VFAWKEANHDGKVDGTNIRERNIKVYRNGVVVPGTTTCDAQPCTAAACCSMAANTWTLQISTFSEWALGGTPCVEAETSKLTLRKVLPPTGDDKLTFVGTLTLPGPGSIETQLDVVNDGVVVRLVDGDVVVLDTEIPGGEYDAGTETGWKVNGLHTAWIYFAPPTGGPGGIKKLKLLDQTANTPGLVKVVVKGSGGAYAAGAAVDAALVLPDSGQCFAATYPAVFPLTPSCIATGGGATIRCR
jgi:hypothetical protein